MVVFQAVRIAALQCMHALTHLPTPVVSTSVVHPGLGASYKSQGSTCLPLSSEISHPVVWLRYELQGLHGSTCL